MSDLCPSCGFSFPTEIINKHANICLDNQNEKMPYKRPRIEEKSKEIQNEKFFLKDEVFEKKKREEEDRKYALDLCRSEHQNGFPTENKKSIISIPQTKNDVISDQFQKNLNSLFDKDTYGLEGNWKKENGKIIVKIKLDPPKDLLTIFQRMKAMKWGVPDLTNAIFFLEITLDSEFYLEYSVPPRVTFSYQPEVVDVGGAMKLIVERKLEEYLQQKWIDKLEKIGMRPTLDVEKGGSILSNDPNLNIWDSDNFFFNLLNITYFIMTTSSTNCTICSNTLPKEPQAVVCDLCITVYSVPFINPASTGSTVRILDSTHPDDEMHLSIVHNAFHELKPIYSTAKYKITKVEYHVNPVLERQYEDYLKRAENKMEMYLWHGTADTNIKPIMKDNFKLNCLGKNSGNRGYYGAGIYFSSKHIRVVYDNKVLLCKVIVGNVYQWPTLKPKQVGCGKMKGYDSHYSGEHSEGKDEFVIFDMERILPSYVIHVVPY